MSGRAAFTIAPGVCKLCGCTEDRACLDTETFEGCHWVNEERTVCNVCALTYSRSLFGALLVMLATDEMEVAS